MLELIEQMIAADLVEEPRPLQENPRTMMQIGDRKGDTATGDVGCNLAEGDGACAIHEIAGTGVQDEMPGLRWHSTDDPADAVSQIVTVEEYDGPLEQVDDHAWDGFGLGVTVQLVETTLAGNAAEQCIAWPCRCTHQPDQRGEDRHDHPCERPER